MANTYPPRLIWSAIGTWIALGISVWTHSVASQEQTVAPESTGASELVEIDLITLPPIPPALTELIEAGEVRFTRGQRNADQLNRRRSELMIRQRLTMAGLTEYRVGYRFRSYNHWQETETNTSKTIRLTVRYEQLAIEREHQIWLRHFPDPDSFWSDRVVLHELDHVRISCDDRLEDRFDEMVRAKTEFQIPLDRNESFSNQRAKQIVEQHVADCFAKVADLIAIRYQELDRVTEHGTRPLPANWIEQMGAEEIETRSPIPLDSP